MGRVRRLRLRRRGPAGRPGAVGVGCGAGLSRGRPTRSDSDAGGGAALLSCSGGGLAGQARRLDGVAWMEADRDAGPSRCVGT